MGIHNHLRLMPSPGTLFSIFRNTSGKIHPYFHTTHSGLCQGQACVLIARVLGQLDARPYKERDGRRSSSEHLVTLLFLLVFEHGHSFPCVFEYVKRLHGYLIVC